MTRAETFTKTAETINLFTSRFNKNMGTRQGDMWKTILGTIKKLETSAAGEILPNTSNLKILRNLRGDLKNTIITSEYKKNLTTFLSGFDELKGINDTYYQAIASGTLNANKNVFNAITSLSVDATKNSLLESGISQEVIAPVEKILNQNVTTGGTFTDLSESLRSQILGGSDKLGSLERYTKQITTDSLNQFNANYNQAMSQELGLQFYYYSGAVKDTTRDYCSGIVNGGKLGLPGGRYYHKKEVEESASLQWAGKISGTNSSSILVNRGGYNCGHQWLAVDTLTVPSSAKDRAAAKGYYNQT